MFTVKITGEEKMGMSCYGMQVGQHLNNIFKEEKMPRKFKDKELNDMRRITEILESNPKETHRRMLKFIFPKFGFELKQ